MYFVKLRDDANTGPAGYVCLESVMEGELPGVDCCVGRETDLLAATPFVLVPAFFAAYVGWPSFLAVDSPDAAALLAATMVHAELSGFFSWACRDDGSCRTFRWLRDACCDAVLGCALRWLRWRCLLRRVLFEVFESGWLPQPAVPLCWIAAAEGGFALAIREVWPRCCDADTGWAWGEHSAPDVVRDGAVHAVSKLQRGD